MRGARIALFATYLLLNHVTADSSSHLLQEATRSLKGLLAKKDGIIGNSTRTSKLRNTKVLSDAEVAQRTHLYTILMAVAGAFVIVLAIVAHIHKTQKLEVPILRWRCGQQPPVEVESIDILEIIKSCFPTRRSDSASSASGIEPGYMTIEDTDGWDELGQPTTEVQPQAYEKDKQSIQDLTQELEERRRRDSHVQLWKRLRRIVLAFLLIAYISVCIAFPQINKSHATCHNGFFWEDHAPFGFTFVATKLIEITFYAFDPSLDGQLVLWQFLLLLLPSFVGYIDAYQDYTSTILAHACAVDPTAHVNHALADELATSMTWSFWVGVFALQWLGVGYLALFLDDSLAVLAKLVHMDALAMCITVDEKALWMMRAVNLVRTFGEDIPQALQQTIYVLYVKVNPFMVVSVVISIGCSFKAVYDAIKRASMAVGYQEQLRKYEEETVTKIKQAIIAGDSLQKLKDEGNDPKLLSLSGVPLGELMEVFAQEELIEAGFTEEQLKKEGKKKEGEEEEEEEEEDGEKPKADEEVEVEEEEVRLAAEAAKSAAEAEKALKLEQERRLAAEAEKKERLAAEAEKARKLEQERLAAEAERKERVAAEAEKARKLEQERLAAEAERKGRVAAEAEKARKLEQERLEAERKERAAGAEKARTKERQFKKAQTSAGIPNGWRLATKAEVEANKAKVKALMGTWDICALADNFKIDGSGYGSKIQKRQPSERLGDQIITNI